MLLVFYAGEIAAGATWAVLKWSGGIVGVTDVAEFVNRAQSEVLAAFLMGLTGMTGVEGGFHYARKWVEKRVGVS